MKVKLMKVKLFTHNDLDGVGAATLAKSHYGNLLDYEICSNDNIDEKVEYFIKSGDCENYNITYIVDLSINKRIADLIDSSINSINSDEELYYRLFLLDHHKTAEWLNIYNWANVVVENKNNVKECGTSLLSNHLYGQMPYEYINHIRDNFVEAVRSYDTWDWKTNNNPYAKTLHNILNIIGIEEFIKKYSFALMTYNGLLIPEEYENLLKYKRLEIEKFIEEKMKQVFFTCDTVETDVTILLDDEQHEINNTQEIRYATVLCDNYGCLSELGSRILKEYPILDYVKLVYPGGIALRSVGDFDVSIIAKKNGGGGHKNAAGYKDNKWYLHMEQK